jgi:hypothetical protein
MADGDNLVIGATNDSGQPTGLDRTGANACTTNRPRDASIAAAPCSIRSVSYP